MRLIDERGLLTALRERLSVAASVDVAMAWVRCGPPLDALLEFAKRCPGKLRVVCGVHDFLTDHNALRSLKAAAELKIAYGTSGRKFHSKLILFSSYSATMAWIGSANLTQSAFSETGSWFARYQTKVQHLPYSRVIGRSFRLRIRLGLTAMPCFAIKFQKHLKVSRVSIRQSKLSPLRGQHMWLYSRPKMPRGLIGLQNSFPR